MVRSSLPRAALVAFVFALVGCKSFADYNKEVAAEMKAVAGALSSAKALPACAPGAEASYFLVSDTTVLSLADGNDAFVAAGASGVTNPCPSTGIDGQEVTLFANRFNPENIRKAGAKGLLAAKGFAVVVVDEVTAPGPRGLGAASGSVVLVSPAGKATCKAPWSATNGERVTVTTDKISVKLGFSPTDDAATRAWQGDLSTRTCAAITKAAPLAPRYPAKTK